MNNIISKKINKAHFIALMLGTLALSLAPIFVRLSETSSSSVAFWRMVIATPFLALAWWFFPAADKPMRSPSLKDHLCLIVAGLSFAADLLCWNLSVVETTVANATLFVNFASLFVALLSWQLLQKPPSSGLLMGMALAIFGSVLLVWPHFKYDLASLMGDGLGLLAGFFYGAYILAVQVIRPAFNTMTIMTITGVITAIAALIMSFVFDHSLEVASQTGWYALLGQAFLVQMLGQSLLAYALVSLPATLSSVVLLLQPALSALIAAYLFNETLVATQIFGMGIILFGIAYAKISDSSQANTAVETIEPLKEK